MEMNDTKACPTKPAKRRLEISIAVKLNMKDVQDVLHPEDIKDVKDIVEKHLTPTLETAKKIDGEFIQERAYTWPRIDVDFKKDREREILISAVNGESYKDEKGNVPYAKPAFKITKVGEDNDKKETIDIKVSSTDGLKNKNEKHIRATIEENFDGDKNYAKPAKKASVDVKVETEEGKLSDGVNNQRETKKHVEFNDFPFKTEKPFTNDNTKRKDPIEEVIEVGAQIDIAIPKDSGLLPSTLSKGIRRNSRGYTGKAPVCKVTNIKVEKEENRKNGLGDKEEEIKKKIPPVIPVNEIRVANINVEKANVTNVNLGTNDQDMKEHYDLKHSSKIGTDLSALIYNQSVKKDDKDNIKSAFYADYIYDTPKVNEKEYAVGNINSKGKIDDSFTEEAKDKNSLSPLKSHLTNVNKTDIRIEEVSQESSTMDIAIPKDKGLLPFSSAEERIKDSIQTLERIFINKSTDTNSDKQGNEEGNESDVYGNTSPVKKEFVRKIVFEDSPNNVECKHVATSPMTPTGVDLEIEDYKMLETPQPLYINEVGSDLEHLTPNDNINNENKNILEQPLHGESHLDEKQREEFVDDNISQEDVPAYQENTKHIDDTKHKSEVDQNINNSTPLTIQIDKDTVERTSENDSIDELDKEDESLTKDEGKKKHIDVKEVFHRILPTCKITYLTETESDENRVRGTLDNAKCVAIDDIPLETNDIHEELGASMSDSTDGDTSGLGTTLYLTKIRKHIKMHDDILTINKNEDFARSPLEFSWESDENIESLHMFDGEKTDIQ